MDEHNIDYKTMFEELSQRFRELLKMDEEFFALSKLVNDQKPYTEKAGEHLLDFTKAEQINALRILSAYGALCKTLCEKYSLLDFDEEEGIDND